MNFEFRQKIHDPGLQNASAASQSQTFVSEYKRKLGLQRLAIQASSTTGKIPGLGSVIQTSGNQFIPNPEKSLKTSFGDNSSLEKQRADKFEKLLDSPNIDLDAVAKLAWSGIPSNRRAHVWKLLMAYIPPTNDQSRIAESLKRRRDEYQQLVQEFYPKRNESAYKETFRQIHIDIPRMAIPLFQQNSVQVGLSRHFRFEKFIPFSHSYYSKEFYSSGL